MVTRWKFNKQNSIEFLNIKNRKLNFKSDNTYISTKNIKYLAIILKIYPGNSKALLR